MRASFSLLVVVAFVGSLGADGLIFRLPADGTWARYSLESTVTLQKDATFTVEGTLTLASVGQEKVDNEMCRWIEVVFEVKLPGKDSSVKSVAKALIPEKRLKKGEDPIRYWLKGWTKVGDEKPMPITKELGADLKIMGPFYGMLSGPLQNVKVLEKKTFECNLGRLTCEGLEGTMTLKDVPIRVVNGKKTMGDLSTRVQCYFHDKAPFGVVALRLLADREYSANTNITFVDTGAGAKSELPESK